MSQTQSEGKLLEKGIEIMEEGDQTSNVGFRFNAQAPEFIPRLTTTTSTTTTTLAPVPVSGYFYPCVHFLGGSSSSPEWFYIEDHHDQPLSPNYWVTNHNINTITTTNNNNNSNNNNNNNIITNNNNNFTNVPMSPSCSKNASNHNINNNSNSNVIPDELQHKIIKQVEYQLSDISLLANETLSKQINKDPEGYVPISVIASTKKIKSLTCNNNMLAEALRGSPKLAVSDDGKKVRRKNPFTDKSKEEIQSRTIVAENLPDDHSHQNLEKIFRVAGSVKTVRVCHPQEANLSRAKGDFIVSNKLHALVEYESTDTAELAVEKLNDERNWRKGLRVRLLLRCSPKSVLKSRRSDFDGATDDDETPTSDCADDTFHSDSMLDSSADENSPMKKGWIRVRGKGKGRGQSHIGRGLGLSTSRPSSPMHSESSPRLGTKGPRMPDGTRGFTMGRGKPLSPLAPTTPLSRFS